MAAGSHLNLQEKERSPDEQWIVPRAKLLRKQAFAIRNVCFPEETSGLQLRDGDAFALKPLNDSGVPFQCRHLCRLALDINALE